MEENLAIRDVAERTGLAAGTIRMWEQRYGFPVPERTPSGYRRYRPDDVDTLRRVQAYRRTGLSVTAAIERARETGGASDLPSLYAAIAATAHGATPQVLRKPTLEALCRAIEHETLAHAAAPVLVGAFQRERFYRPIEARWRRMAAHADAAVVFADFARPQHPAGGPVELPIAPAAALGNEWALIVDAPGFAACLAGWEQPESGETGDRARRFETIWTLDPEATRRAARGIDRGGQAAGGARGAARRLGVERPDRLEAPG
ncbi:MAG TPA: DICT sensory domain-containing protein, partial [Solirubrobacteraceae bacterium]|nr:DICT sensory domain-containing protein [Solirubrobacteraceae bacterium]